MESAEQVAKAFLQETDPAQRLPWVRDPEGVKERIPTYPEEARSMVGVIDEVMGHRVAENGSLTGFVIRFPSGNLRLLEVVDTADGPRVDWDAYARHGTASWDDLLGGRAQRSVVRVFCEPATERVKPFTNQAEWTCFRLSSPELPQAVLAYARAGSLRETKMKESVLATPTFRQRFTLEIAYHRAGEEPVFEIVKCLAVGWVVTADIEERWATGNKRASP